MLPYLVCDVTVLPKMTKVTLIVSFKILNIFQRLAVLHFTIENGLNKNKNAMKMEQKQLYYN